MGCVPQRVVFPCLHLLLAVELYGGFGFIVLQVFTCQANGCSYLQRHVHGDRESTPINSQYLSQNVEHNDMIETWSSSFACARYWQRNSVCSMSLVNPGDSIQLFWFVQSKISVVTKASLLKNARFHFNKFAAGT